MVLVLISLAIFLVYTLGVCVLFKSIPTSISDTFYRLEKVHKGLGSLFTFFCWGVAFCLVPFLLDHLDDNKTIIGALAAAGLCLVGAAPYFKSHDRTAHYIGAFTCIVFSQYWAILQVWWVASLCWGIYVLGTLLYMSFHRTGIFEKTLLLTKPMFWIEICAFFSVYLTIYFCYGR